MVTLKKPMLEEYLSQKNRLKNIYKKRIYSIDEIKQSYLMCKKHRMVCADLNYIEHLLILVFGYWMEFHFCFCFFLSS